MPTADKAEIERAVEALLANKILHCGCSPRALDLGLIKLKGSRYFDYPFECLVCGAILEVDDWWDAHHAHSGGSMGTGRSYTRHSHRFWFNMIEHYPGLKPAYKRWSKRNGESYHAELIADKACEAKIDAVSRKVGGLTRNQRDTARDRLCQKETEKRKEQKKKREQIYRDWIADIRAVLGLPDWAKRARDT